MKLLTDMSQFYERRQPIIVKFKLSNQLWTRFLKASHLLTKMVTFFPQCHREDLAITIMDRILKILEYYEPELDQCLIDFREEEVDPAEKKNY